VGFEFLVGHYVMGYPWIRLFHDYNIFAGRLWVVLLLWITVASSTRLSSQGDRPMSLSAREFWGVVHGMVLGALFLLAYGGGWPACTASGRTG
jgi:hypothetical protein